MLDNSGTQLRNNLRLPTRRRTVLVVLAIHVVLTLVNFSLIGQAGGPSPTGIYSHYFVYTSIPTILIVPLLPHIIQESSVTTVCFLINGVCVAWLMGIGLHYLFYSVTGRLASIDAKEPKRGEH